MAPAYLAGAFSSTFCDLQLYSELASGLLPTGPCLAGRICLFSPPHHCFDRMRHLAAYVGPKIPMSSSLLVGLRSGLPDFSCQFFDYCCTGDVEQLREVIADAFGPDYVAAEMLPRFDLASWVGQKVGYVETTRNCNFRCSFCSLTGDGLRFDEVFSRLSSQSDCCRRPKKFLVFLDNNFYWQYRKHFQARLHLIGSLRQQGLCQG